MILPNTVISALIDDIDVDDIAQYSDFSIDR